MKKPTKHHKKAARKVARKKLTARQRAARYQAMARTERKLASKAMAGARAATKAAAVAMRNHKFKRAKAELALARRDRSRAKLDLRKARADAKGHPLASTPIKASRPKKASHPLKSKKGHPRKTHPKKSSPGISLTSKASARKRRAKLANPAAMPGGWILGGNDRRNSCAAVAVANSLLAVTGIRATDAQVEALYAAATGRRDRGATIPETLTAARAGLAGWYPATVTQLDDGEPIAGDGLILYLDLQTAQRRQDVWDYEPTRPWGDHAGILAGGHVITWGAAHPVTPSFLAAQAVAWRVDWAPIPPAGGDRAPQLGDHLPAGPA